MNRIMITPQAYAALTGKKPAKEALDHTGKCGLSLAPDVARDLRRQRQPHEDYSTAIIRLAAQR